MIERSTVLRVDAGWDVLLGVLAAVWMFPSAARALGLPSTTWWPLLAVLALGSWAFAVVLWRAPGSDDETAVTTAAAIANAAAAVAGVVVAVLSGSVLVWLAALGCAVFAVLEGLSVRTGQPTR